ncbi:hypothetical protein D1871_15235 [Nakamurella silvestris]|nr:hypothetical protein D1871_15235 [Nakamurella silvestris]
MVPDTEIVNHFRHRDDSSAISRPFLGDVLRSRTADSSPRPPPRTRRPPHRRDPFVTHAAGKPVKRRLRTLISAALAGLLAAGTLTVAPSVATAAPVEEVGETVPAATTPMVGGYLLQGTPNFSNVQMDLVTHFFWAFSTINNGVCTTATTAGLNAVIAQRQARPNLKVIRSIGGWGARGFSDAASTDAKRKVLVQSCIQSFVANGATDGFDLDWEFPVSGGLNNIGYSPDDRKNMNLLVDEFRAQLNAYADANGKNRRDFLVTAALPAGRWQDSGDNVHGAPYDTATSFDLETLGRTLDFINVMTYDMGTGYSPVSMFNQPLYKHHLDNTGDPWNSIDDAITYYLNHGVPAKKMSLGVEFTLKRGFVVTDTVNNGLFRPWTATGCGTLANNFKSPTSTALINWDDEVKSPYLWDPAAKRLCSYEDPQSLGLRAQYAKDRGLNGTFSWELTGDAQGSELRSIAKPWYPQKVTAAPAPTVTGKTVGAVANKSFTKVLAEVSGSSAESLTAIVNWGDNTRSAATVTPTGTGSFVVSGTHKYTAAGKYPLTVTLTDPDPINSRMVNATVLVGNDAVAQVPQIIPVPTTVTPSTDDDFVLGPDTKILVQGTTPAEVTASTDVAEKLAARLRSSTGFALPVVKTGSATGAITLKIGDPGAAGDEAYSLKAAADGVTITARGAHGLFNGTQSLRQLLPVWADSTSVQQGPWLVPGVTITDSPRFSYRGMMLDIGRHYQPVEVAKSMVDQISAYKINVLHLHLSDDQGFRVRITGRPELTTIGGQYSMNGDPGGFWTQAEYESFVAYAAERFVDVIPEVDSPGHNNATVMAYADKAPEINCTNKKPAVWNMTGAVGYSAMCPESPKTWEILGDITAQLSDLSKSKYYNIGGDEVPATILTHAQYDSFVDKMSNIVRAQGKIVMGWAEISSASFAPVPSGVSAVAQFWANGAPTGTAGNTARVAVQKGMKVLMSPANRAYLDMKYVGSTPATLGQTWAGRIEVPQMYNWDPANYIPALGALPAVTESDVIGVEAPLWTETIVTQDDIEYMTYPRLPAMAEVGWSAQANRNYTDFSRRLAAQGARWQLNNQNFFPSPEVPWRLDATGNNVLLTSAKTVSGKIATVAAPSRAAGTVTATIDWGDGQTSAGTLTGTPITGVSINGLYTVAGEHTYATDGPFTATVTVTAAGATAVTTRSVVSSSTAAKAQAPTGVSATAGSRQVALTWTAPADNGGSPITGYEVTPWIGGVAGTPIYTSTPATKLVVTDLVNGTVYGFSVAAVTSVGAGAASATTPAVTPARVPNPSSTATGAVNAGTVTFTWNTPGGRDPGSPLTGFVVTPYIDGVAQADVAINDPAVRTYSIASTQVGKVYQFAVRSVNALGISQISPRSLGVATKATSTVVLAPTAPAGPIGQASSVVATVTVSDGVSTKGTVTVKEGSVTVGSAPVTSGTATIALPATLTAGLHKLVATFTPADPAIAQPATSGAAEYTVHFTDYPPPTTPGSQPFYDDILWLASQGITTGNADGTFSPKAQISRQAIAAFLYRFANPGATPAACTSKPFSDVGLTNQFCGHIKWLTDQGITTGNGDGTFSPAATVSREAFAAFLFRLKNPGQAIPTCTTKPMKDVSLSSPFCGAIAWMVAKDLTKPYPDGGFHPATKVDREATAALLHRLSVLPG